jgi:tight adherence protein B
MTFEGGPLAFMDALGLNATRGIAIGGIILAIFIATFGMVADPASFAWKYWARYTSALERKLRAQFIWTRGRTIALAQLGALVALACAATLLPIPHPYVWTLVVAVGPWVWIERQRRQRVEALEKQLDGFVLALANALKTTPSIGAALGSVVPLLADPIRQEVELAVKEMKVGSTLDQALLHMAARIGSRQVDSALSAVLIGRQVGGNLSKLLEQTAATLREMARLEGVVRTKTAEGKMQIAFLAALPIALVVGLNFMWPGYFAPLTNSLAGYVIVIVCGGLWIAAIFVARKILDVDV